MTGNDSALRTTVYVVLLLLAIHALLLVVMVPLMMGLGWDMHTTWHGSGGGWGWILMWFVPILVFAGLGYLLYTVVDSDNEAHGSRAMNELRTAYARGSLLDEEFEHRRTQLRQNEGDNS